MRRLFIAFGILIFLVYCWASVVYQNQVDVPDYKLVEVDVLGGVSRSVWDGDQQVQFQRLMVLEGKQYQMPEDAKGDISPDKPLTSDDFAAFVAKAPAGQPVKVQLRDTSAIYGLLAHNYLLRDSIPDPAGAQPQYVGGRPPDKAMLDDLRGKGVKVITVTGHGAPVNFQLGTSLMIAVIFFTLAAALKPIVWDPFLAMLERRARELEIGSEAERQNQQEAVRFEEEKRRRYTAMNRDVQDLRMQGQREIAGEAGAIVKEARDREKEVKLAGLREIGQAAGLAEAEMERRIPELAQQVADALTPGMSGLQWERMDQDS